MKALWVTVYSLATLALLSSSAVSAQAVPLRLSGLYGNVRYFPDSGDLGGAEIEIHAEGERPWVEFTLCEGWCGRRARFPMTIGPEAATFDYFEESLACPSGKIESQHSRMTLVLKGHHLYLTSTGFLTFGPEKLNRLKARYGLNVAQSDEELKVEQAERGDRHC